MEISFEIPGKPFAKQRPRFARAGNYVRTYTPEATVSYEQSVSWHYVQQCGNTRLTGPLEAVITAVFSIPKSVSKKRRAELEKGDTPYDKRPDGDNLIKALLDSLNHIAYDDDGAVTDINIKKRYGIEPKTTVTIREIKA